MSSENDKKDTGKSKISKKDTIVAELQVSFFDIIAEEMGVDWYTGEPLPNANVDIQEIHDKINTDETPSVEEEISAIIRADAVAQEKEKAAAEQENQQLRLGDGQNGSSITVHEESAVYTRGEGTSLEMAGGKESINDRVISDNGGNERVLSEHRKEVQREVRQSASSMLQESGSSNQNIIRDRKTDSVLPGQERGNAYTGVSSENEYGRENGRRDSLARHSLPIVDLDTQRSASPLERSRKNIEALRICKNLCERQKENADVKIIPTEEEYQKLALYSGWGGAPDAFNKSKSKNWEEINNSLVAILSEEEYIQARSTVLTAFYTPQAVVNSILTQIQNVGFNKDGKNTYILEPGCGTGNFVRSIIQSMPAAYTQGVEIDNVSADIASWLCGEQNTNILKADFGKCVVPQNSFDVVVGNVPYSEAIKIDKKPIHDWFIDTSIDSLRAGGICAVLTSRFTMDKKSVQTRMELAKKAELVGAVRLNDEVFAEQAGTSVVSDILFFQKRAKALSLEEVSELEWIGVSEFATSHINNLFENHAEYVVGNIVQSSNKFGDTLNVIADKSSDLSLEEQIANALSTQKISKLTNIRKKLGKRKVKEPMVIAKPNTKRSYTWELADDESIWYMSKDEAESLPSNIGLKKQEKMRQMLHIRNKTRDLFTLEAKENVTDEEIEQNIAALNSLYDDFVADYGYLSEPENESVFNIAGYSDGTLYKNLFSLEESDNKEGVVRKSDILSKRTVFPTPPRPTHLDDPLAALSQSLDVKNQVDLKYIAGLLSMVDENGQYDENFILEQLNDKVILVPKVNSVGDIEFEAQLMAELQSDNVRRKLDNVNKLLDDELNAGKRAQLAKWHERLHINNVDGEHKFVDDEVLDERLNPYAYDKFSAIRQTLRSSGIWKAVTQPYTTGQYMDIFAQLDSRKFKDFTDGSFGTLLLQEYLQDIDVLSVNDLVEVVEVVQNENKKYEKKWKNAFLTELMNAEFDDISPTSLDLAKTLILLNDKTESSEDLAKMLFALSAAETLSYRQNDSFIMRLSACCGFSESEKIGYDLCLEFAEKLKNEPSIAEFLFAVSYDKSISSVRELPRYAVMEVDTVAANEWKGKYAEFCKERGQFIAENAVDEPNQENIARLQKVKSALEQALPEKLGKDEIVATLSSSWIPTKFIYDFMREKLCNKAGSLADLRKLSVQKSEENGTWQVSMSSANVSPDAEAKYGVEDYPLSRLITAAMNNSVISLTGKDGKKDSARTSLAISRTEALRNDFKEWIWEDGTREKVLVDIYNKKYNNFVPRVYDGSYLTFGDMSHNTNLYQHQRNAIARILQSDEGTLVAHVVGAGKTFTSIAAVMEAKKLQRARKPLIVVPNHLTEQWAADFAELYPTSKILCFDDNYQKAGQQGVQMFWGRAANGDWDAVIVGMSKFDRLSLSPELQESFYKARIDELTEQLRMMAAEGSDEKSFSVKEAEKARAKLETSLEKLSKKERTDNIYFDDLGCDMLVVDEAHMYKNLAQSGGRLPGMSVSASMKCEDLLAKCDYLRQKGAGRNIVFATGTPVSNTMVELFNMQRYLAPRLLTEQGIREFPAWANTFGAIVQSVEVKPEGTGFDTKMRFAKFHNLPELMSIFHCYADLQTQKDINLDVPQVETVDISVDPSDIQRDLVKDLSARAERVHDGTVLPTEDNMLKITSDGRKIALDPRLYDERIEEREGKVDTCVKIVKDTYDKTQNEKATQLIFCDSSTDAGDKNKFNIYTALRDKLANLGIPREEVASVGDAKNADDKERLFEKVRQGEIRVLLGSTAKLGTGTNVQDRLIAIHNLDCPWRPSDLEQRLGRIQRKGNMFDEVKSYRYVTTGTFDAYMYQTVERKQKFISQVFSSESPSREMADVDETVLSYAEIKQLATGDPLIADIIQLENEKMQLELTAKADRKLHAKIRKEYEQVFAPAVVKHEQTVAILEKDNDSFVAAYEQVKTIQQKIETMNNELEEKAKAAGERPQKANYIENCIVDGVAYKESIAANKSLMEQAEKIPVNQSGVIGEFCGLNIIACREFVQHGNFDDESCYLALAPKSNDMKAVLTSAQNHKSPMAIAHSSTGNSTPLNQLMRLIKTQAEALEPAKKAYLEAKEKAENAKAALDKPIESETKLQELEIKLAKKRAGVAETENKTEQAAEKNAEITSGNIDGIVANSDDEDEDVPNLSDEQIEKFMPADLAAIVPVYYEGEDISLMNKKVYAKYFLTSGSAMWLMFEYSAEIQEFFCLYVDNGTAELGYSSFAEFQVLNDDENLPTSFVEMDTSFNKYKRGITLGELIDDDKYLHDMLLNDANWNEFVAKKYLEYCENKEEKQQERTTDEEVQVEKQEQTESVKAEQHPVLTNETQQEQVKPSVATKTQVGFAANWGVGDIFGEQVSWFKQLEQKTVGDLEIGDIIESPDDYQHRLILESISELGEKRELHFGQIDRCSLMVQHGDTVMTRLCSQEFSLIGHSEDMQIAEYGRQEFYKEQLGNKQVEEAVQTEPTPVYEPPAQTEPSLEDLPPVFEPIEEPAQEEEKKPKFVPSTHEELAQRAAEYNANLKNSKGKKHNKNDDDDGFDPAGCDGRTGR